MTAKQGLIAACGLDCEACEIRRAPFDAYAARVLVSWFREMGWLQEDEGLVDALERGMTCQGCHADRSRHWSADCWILACCVDDRGLAFCHECDEFPCQRLAEWATQNESYSQALSRLNLLAES